MRTMLFSHAVLIIALCAFADEGRTVPYKIDGKMYETKVKKNTKPSCIDMNNGHSESHPLREGRTRATAKDQ